MSPMARSLQHLRDNGFTACVVEKTLPKCFTKQDAFGFGDILAFKPAPHFDYCDADCGVWLVQTTSASNHAARRSKALALPALKGWLSARGRFAVLSWTKKGPRGKRKLWTPRWEEIR